MASYISKCCMEGLARNQRSLWVSICWIRNRLVSWTGGCATFSGTSGAWEVGILGPQVLAIYDIGVWQEFGPTRLSFLEYLLIGLASALFPSEILNREGSVG
jgi:hypothetical protein